MNITNQRLDVLEARVALIESQLRSQTMDNSESQSSPNDRDRERLGHLVKILQKLGGSGSLDEIAARNKAITKAGTRAQLLRLCDVNTVYQPKRGIYALKVGE